MYMDNKLRQVTDNIHGTIYLSSLESEMISTPYFYRLHDVYQSSTVYLTFPSNRTKRYEHSLGTMELASSILFSAVSNAHKKTRGRFFKQLEVYFFDIYDTVVNNFHAQNANYLLSASGTINLLFKNLKHSENAEKGVQQFVKDNIKTAFQDDAFHDAALDHFQLHPISYSQDRGFGSIKNMFLYRCLLEAVRIVGLFHDVGHPPYSHIIEEVIDELYDQVSNVPASYNKDRADYFIKVMKQFRSSNSKESFSCHTALSNSSLINAHTHERIGLAFLQNAVNDVMPDMIKRIENKNYSDDVKAALVMYYVTVTEFIMAIQVERDWFFQSIHRIIDGIIDADRLDYVVRDSLNSGIDWGKVPYKRLIDSAKLFYVDKIPSNAVDKGLQGKEGDPVQFFVIAYPKKVTDDIIDLLLTRYKIFARINFHHRCIKTSAALKASVKELALNYLRSSGMECINEDIRLLWEALSSKAGDISARVIQWNDSWLISVLHKSLVNLSENRNLNNSELRENLEEILLNKKNYYSLLKRGDDNKEFVNKVLRKMGTTRYKLSKLEIREENKLRNEAKKSASVDMIGTMTQEDEGEPIGDLFSGTLDAFESLQRIEMIQPLENTGDLSLLSKLIPGPETGIADLFRMTLENAKEEGIIKSYQIYENTGRSKCGLPEHNHVLNNIYLYNEDIIEVFNEQYSLLGQIRAVQNCVSEVFVYYMPAKEKDYRDIGNVLLNKMADELASKCTIRKKELFGNSL